MNTEINSNIFNSFPALESERLLFREMDLRDSNDMFLLRSNADVMKYMDSDAYKSIKEAEQFIKVIIESFKDKTGISWGIVEKGSGKFIGYFGFWKIISEHCRAEIGFALRPEFQGKGYMTETFKVMIPFGFNNIKLHSIYGDINPNNISSIKLHEKFGFKKEAYYRENRFFNSKFVDSVIYTLMEYIPDQEVK